MSSPLNLGSTVVMLRTSKDCAALSLDSTRWASTSKFTGESTCHESTPLTSALSTKPPHDQNWPEHEYPLVATSQNVHAAPSTSNYASIWRRAAAWVADVLLFLGGLEIVTPVLIVMGFRNFSLVYAVAGWWAYVVVAVAYGATVGNRAASIKVVDISGNSPGFKKSFVRSLFPTAIACAVVFAAGNLDLIPEWGEARSSLKFSPCFSFWSASGLSITST